MNGAMDSRAVRGLLFASGLICSVGCSPPEPAAAPEQTAERDEASDREVQALEERRQQLEKELLADLRKLREARQASTGGADVAHDDSSDECEILVFGGPIREVFLGCLSDESRADSVFNLKGEHGSNISPLSIRNKFTPYGSNHDDTSACSTKAKHPPVVVASDGKSLGLLTVNPALDRRIKTASVSDWLLRMCGL